MAEDQERGARPVIVRSRLTLRVQILKIQPPSERILRNRPSLSQRFAEDFEQHDIAIGKPFRLPAAVEDLPKLGFQDGNGRLSRILNNLLLLQAGYSFASYSSLESVIEHNKESYYLALRRTQTTLAGENADWDPWSLLLLRSMHSQIDRLRERIEELPAVGDRIPSLSPLAERLARLLRERGTLSVAAAAAATDTSRNTLKDKFRELVEAGVAELHGKGRGAHCRPTGH